jgi:hypothetical protein
LVNSHLLECSVVIILVPLCCGVDNSSAYYSSPRILDAVCRAGACSTTGAVQQTAGLTGDSIAYQVGPGDGSLELPSLYKQQRFELLVAGKGAFELGVVKAGCSVCVPVFTTESLSEDGTWLAVSGSPIWFRKSEGAAWILDMREVHSPDGCM